MHHQHNETADKTLTGGIGHKEQGDHKHNGKKRKEDDPVAGATAIESSIPTTESIEDFPAAEPIDSIQQKVNVFQMKMQQIADVLDRTANVDHLKILSRDTFYTQFYIDKDAIARLINISMREDFSCFGVYFGLEDPDTHAPIKDPKAPGLGRLTCCFVGLDTTDQVLIDHFPPTEARPLQVKPEETWPPPPPLGVSANTFNLTHDANVVNAFFNPRT